MKTYSREQVYEATLAYFGGDDLATNVFIDKYCLKDGEDNYLELTPQDMHIRLATEFARIEEKFGGPNKLDFDTILSWLENFDFIVPQGSIMYGLGNDFSYNSLSNCTVVESPQDSISSIMNVGRDMANLFKMRCGVGVDISSLRPDGAKVNNSARTSTGAWSFVRYYSEVVNTIGQKGRRGALIITLDCSHPDVIRFATSKQDLSISTGANISLKIYDDFMSAVHGGEEYTLHWTNGVDEYIDVVKAREVWGLIVKAAADTAEPGLLFWDRHLKYNPSSEYEELRPICTNPCGEQALAAEDVCRLTSCNLKNLVISPFTEEAKVDFKKLKEMYKVAARLGDDLVELELEKIQNIISKAEREGDTDNLNLWKKFYDKGRLGRRIGTGAHGLADMLASVCVRYDSEEGVGLVDKVFATIRNTLYSESVSLAEERGAFELFDWDKEKDNEYILSLPKKIRDKMAKVGRRNVCLLTCAPTGSVSICSQSSSGIEPIFRNQYTRRRKINKTLSEPVEGAFMAEDGQVFEEFSVYHPLVSKWKELNSRKRNLPDYFVESNTIDPAYRVKMQATIQKNVDSSISSTVNLPKGTDYSVVGDLYMQAWEAGLKGITVYVEGSREGVLVSEENELFGYHCAPGRPEVLECDILHTQVQGKQWVVFVGLLDGKPYEIFAGLAKYVELPKKYVKGFIVKRSYKTKNSEYDLVINKGSEDQLVVKNIVETFENPNHGVLGRLISLSLRHGTKPAYLSEQLLKDTDFDFQSYSKCMGRVLKKYIVNGERPENGKDCKECGGGLVYEEGCVLCRSCGFSKCG